MQTDKYKANTITNDTWERYKMKHIADHMYQCKTFIEFQMIHHQINHTGIQVMATEACRNNAWYNIVKPRLYRDSGQVRQSDRLSDK